MALSLFTRAEFKTHAGISGTDHDTFIDELVVDMQSVVERELGRPLEDSGSDVTEYYDGTGTNALRVRRYPIQSVTSIHVDADRDWTSDTEIDSTDYVIDADAGLLRMLPTTLVSKWSTVNFPRGVSNVRVIYQGGYKDSGGTAVPGALRRGALIWALAMFNTRAAAGVTNFSSASLSYSFETTPIPARAEELLSSYRAVATGAGFNT